MALLPRGDDTSMNQFISDATIPGAAFWLTGYLLSLLLFFTPLAGIMGWILFACLTPVMAIITYRWFRRRGLPLIYFAQIAVSWTAIAVVLDYVFIVRLFRPAAYYQPDVLLYYAVTFLLPLAVGWYLLGKGSGRSGTRAS